VAIEAYTPMALTITQQESALQQYQGVQSSNFSQNFTNQTDLRKF